MPATESDWSTAYRTLRPSLGVCRSSLGLAIGLAIAGRWIFLPLPFLLRSLLRQDGTDLAAVGLTVFGIDLRWPELALVGLLPLAGFRMGLVWGQRVMAERAAQSAIASLRRRMMEHLLKLKLGYFDRRASGKVVLRFVGDANAIRSFLAVTLVNVAADVPTVLAITILLFVINWNVALLICAAMPVALLAFALLNPRLRTRTRLARSLQSRLCSHLTQRLDAIETIKAAAAETREAEAGATLIGEVAAAQVGRSSVAGALAGVTAGLFLAVFGAAIWLGGRQTASGAMTVPDLLAFLLLLTFLQAPVRRVAGANAGFQRAHVALERIRAFLDRDEEPGYRRRKRRPRFVGRSIELVDVAFRYRRRGDSVFDGLSLDVHGPGLVTLEGPTGSGKSTVLSLILRLRRPQRGRIVVDGVSLAGADLQSVRRQIAWLPQDVRLIEGTVADNVRFARPSLSDDRIRALLARVLPTSETDVPSVAPETRVMTLGRNLSPVQRVQVGLARALATNARILLLDDPTAHMKRDDEKALRRLLKRLRGQRLIVVATARRWILDAADQRIDLVGAAARAPEGVRSVTISIVSVGDTMLGDGAMPLLEAHGWEYPFGHLRSLMERGDMILGNLEGPITARTDPRMPWRKWAYRQEPAVAAALASLGFRSFCLANNHVMDHGPAGLLDTIRSLEDAGIRTFGAGRDVARAGDGITIDLPGVRVGLVACMQTYRVMRQGGAYALPEQPGVSEWEPRSLRAELDRLRGCCDVVIASVHWGRTYRPPTPQQFAMGRQLIDWGADAVNGHHPHVPQCVEVYRGRPILYSLGNFVFGSPGRFAGKGMDAYGMVATYVIRDRRIGRVELDLIRTDNAEVRYRPRPLEPDEARRALAELTAPACEVRRWDGARAVIDLAEVADPARV